MGIFKTLIYFCALGIFCGGTCNGDQVKQPADAVDTFDFIIVGGGTSGCAVAGRLSEKHSVLLLEAGGDPGNVLDVPATAFSFLGNPAYSKVYKSVSQTKAGLANPDAQIDYRIGSVLGGSSSINGLIYGRASPHDYDNWARIANDSSWEYKNLLKFFKRMEDYQGNFPSDERHGKGGPITISGGKDYTPGLEEWLEAGEFMGHPSRRDPNGPQAPGFAHVEYTRRLGRRVSAFTGYVKPFLNVRKNLKVVTEAEVKRILFNEKKDRAVGVTYNKLTKDGTTITVKALANKEIIISAGVMDSPAILLRSGVGPVDVLGKSKIPVVKYLPVGHNLQDHQLVVLHVQLNKEKSEVFIPERDLTPENWDIFEKTGDGPYSSLMGLHSQAYLVSSVRKGEAQPNPDWADVHLVHLQSSDKVHVLPEEKKKSEEGLTAVSTVVILVRPKSRGRVILNSSDVDALPLIDFQFLSHPDDMSVLLEAVKNTVDIYEKTPSFQKQGAFYSKEPYEPCKDFPFRSDDYWRCFLSHMTGSCLHAGGTCRMGAGKDDPTAVVNSQLKVIGIEALRVVDLSIMPNVPNAPTQASAYVIAEKASEMILNEWSNTRSDEAQSGKFMNDEL